MEQMSHAVSLTTQWIQPKAMTRHFELTDGTKTYATVDFEKVMGSLARAVVADGKFTIKRVGFLNPRVTVRRENSDEDIAVFHPRWTGSAGEVQCAGDRKYSFKTANFWATRHNVEDARGNTVLSLHSGMENAKLADAFKTQARLEMAPSMRDNPDLSLLVVMVWYILILQQEDAVAAAT